MGNGRNILNKKDGKTMSTTEEIKRKKFLSNHFFKRQKSDYGRHVGCSAVHLGLI